MKKPTSSNNVSQVDDDVIMEIKESVQQTLQTDNEDEDEDEEQEVGVTMEREQSPE